MLVHMDFDGFTHPFNVWDKKDFCAAAASDFGEVKVKRF
jgi:hypothetical protein